MPYIKQERRDELEPVLQCLVDFTFFGIENLFTTVINCDKIISSDILLIKCICLMDELEVMPNGEINYLLFCHCKRIIYDQNKESYNNYKEYISMLYKIIEKINDEEYKAEIRECICEIRRRFLYPYEDKKIRENGDII